MDIIGCRFQEVMYQQKSIWRELVIFTERKLEVLRASLCKILISSFAHKMDFAHNFPVDFF